MTPPVLVGTGQKSLSLRHGLYSFYSVSMFICYVFPKQDELNILATQISPCLITVYSNHFLWQNIFELISLDKLQQSTDKTRMTSMQYPVEIQQIIKRTNSHKC